MFVCNFKINYKKIFKIILILLFIVGFIMIGVTIYRTFIKNAEITTILPNELHDGFFITKITKK